MDELEITIGQRSLPSVHGEQTTATAYAGLGSRHLLVLADGGVGQVPSRLAAQIASTAAVARFRASVFPRTDEQLQEAVAEAHLAVRRGALGTQAEGHAGVALLVVVIEPGGVTAARVGGGRVYILSRGTRRSLFREDGHGIVGGDPVAAEIVADHEALPPGSRVVCVTEAVARATAADLDHLAAGPPAQLAAARLADAARRRGQYEPLAAQVCEIQRGPDRPGPHPAIARIDRESSRTLSADGRWIGAADPARNRTHPSSAGSGWVLWFVVAALLGAGAALIGQGTGAPVVVPSAPAPVQPALDLADALPAAPPVPVEDVSPAPEAAASDGLDPATAADIAALFDASSPSRAARAVRNYITKRFAIDGERVFTDLEAWITTHDDAAVVGTLLELMKEQDLKRTTRWVAELLPRLFARGATGAADDAAP